MALIEAIGVTKVYPGGLVANDAVNLSVEKGEVHAVVGENGAGKSTLMKILFGIEQADRGELRLAGQAVRFANPRAAIDAGIGMRANGWTIRRSSSPGDASPMSVPPAPGAARLPSGSPIQICRPCRASERCTSTSNPRI